MATILDVSFTHVFVEAGTPHDWYIDAIDPENGKSRIFGETLEQVRKRYPDAQVMSWLDFKRACAERQDTPVTWSEVTQEHFNEMLNVLPPIYGPGGFMVSEACDHCAKTGAPRFAAYRERGGKFWESSRPMTVAEFRKG